MDRRERAGDPQTAMRAVQQELASTLWTTLPGIIESYDSTKQTCSIKPAIKARVQSQRGAFSWVELPLLVDCPVIFPAGGGVALTFPVVKGDEALVMFADRCIDNWWKMGGIQEQPDLRMHDLSDGFALVGIASLPRVMPGLSNAGAQLRTTAGTTKVEVTPAGNVNLTAAAEVTVAAPIVRITGTLIINGIPYATHVHTGVQTGGANTGGLP
jgi:hypothetical protein